MGYRVLIITTDYLAFIRWFYTRHPGLDKRPYEEQVRFRRKTQFGLADIYCNNLRTCGNEAVEVYSNNEFMQKIWAREHNIRSIFLTFGPFFKNYRFWLYTVLKTQIKNYKPDVLINHSMNSIDVNFLKDIKPYTRLIIGQHAATQLPENADWRCYDLVISSFLPTVQWFRQKGVRAELYRLAFEPRILKFLQADSDSRFDITFVGSFHKVHNSRTAFLENICDTFRGVKVWGHGINHLSSGSPIRKCYMGQAWGLDMYNILKASKITFNHHGDVPAYANNMRLFEATGVGTLLLTDWKKNLHDMFEPDKEVVVYRNQKECIAAIKYYLEHSDERSAIALAGQKRVLQDHTYNQRMSELLGIIHKLL
jgi:spore maturation protein CgeB